MIIKKSKLKKRKKSKTLKDKRRSSNIDKIGTAKIPAFITSEQDLLPVERPLRLSQVARKLNKGLSEIVSYLIDNGYDVKSTPNFKLNEDQLNFLNNSKIDKEITDTCVIDYTWKLIEDLKIDYNIIFSISPEQFEQLVAEFLTQSGFKVQSNGDTNRKDGGIDIIAWKKDIVTIILAVQVKFKFDKTSKVKTGEVRDFKGAMAINDYFNAGMVVTNTDFTVDSRWIEDQVNSKLELKNSLDLKNWLKNNFTSKKEIKLDLNLGKDIYYKDEIK